MGLNRDKFRKIVGGITTAEPAETPAPEAEPVTATSSTADKPHSPAAGQGSDRAGDNSSDEEATATQHRRFAKRGRPKGRKDDAPAAKTRKVKVSLFLSEYLVNDFYDWAHADKMHPGEMFERALKPFHEREAKRRNAGKE